MARESHDPGVEEEYEENATLLPHQSPSSPQPTTPSVRIKWPILILAGTLILTFETGNAIRVAPLIARYQEVLCQEQGQPANCSKIKVVASNLAMILGLSQFLECIPVLLLSGFYGSMADKYGRRAILLLGFLGMILSSTWTTAVGWLAPVIPLRLVWVGPVFTIIGGGASVPISIIMTTAADVVLPTQRVSAYSFIHGTALVSGMLGAALASVMMTSTGNYVPQVTGLIVMWVALCLSIFLPNTGPMTISSIASEIGCIEEDSSDDSLSLSPTKRSLDVKAILQATSRSFYNLWQVKGAIPVLVAGFVSMLGQQVQILILQYMPERFDISLAEANTFNIVNYAVNLLTLFILVPLTSTLLLRRSGNTAFHKDRVLGQISSVLFVVGALVLSVAPMVSVAILGMIIFGTGIGVSSLLRSIFVELFPPERAAFATTLISAVKSIGGSLSGPIYSYAFGLSLSLHGILQGLPFLVSAACFVIVGLVLTMMGDHPASLL